MLNISEEIRLLFRSGTKLKVFLDRNKYADAEVLYTKPQESLITIKMTNDSGAVSYDTFYFDFENKKPGWRWCNPNNFYGSSLGGPEFFVTEQIFEFTPAV